MDTYAYKGISDGKYVEGDIEALNQDEASHKLKEQKIIITNLVRAVKGKKKEDKETKKKKIAINTSLIQWRTLSFNPNSFVPRIMYFSKVEK